MELFILGVLLGLFIGAAVAISYYFYKQLKYLRVKNEVTTEDIEYLDKTHELRLVIDNRDFDEPPIIVPNCVWPHRGVFRDANGVRRCRESTCEGYMADPPYPYSLLDPGPNRGGYIKGNMR